MTARFMRRAICGISLLSLAVCAIAQREAQPTHLFLQVHLSPAFKQPVSGRLLVFVASGANGKAVDVSPMSPGATYVTAKEVRSWLPDTTIDVDADDVVFPGKLSAAKPGDYQAQAVLDIDHSYNYVGRHPGDLISDVVPFTSWNPAQGSAPAITLTSTIPSGESQSPYATAPKQTLPEVGTNLKPIEFVSPSLSRFWGRDIVMKGWVLLPPGYDSHPSERYPTVYYTHGFGGNVESLKARGPILYGRMQSKKMPEMIWVLLDESSPTGTHEFADGVNNGPWGHALTAELIPYLESHYRMDAKPSGRFLQGHSSGGWATLWLQTTYPKIFGGTWSTAPDPSDFHAFSTVDLYAPHANVYRNPDGTPIPIIRDHGQVVATLQQLAQIEQVLGDYGGQLASFEWVFSPRGADGRPKQMFDRQSGDVDPNVVAYWGKNYDIARRVQANWASLAPQLQGKIHVIVGTGDTFYLDGAAHRLQSVLDRLRAGASFTFIPDKTHFDLYSVGDDRAALFDRIAAEMYAVARGSSSANRSTTKVKN